MQATSSPRGERNRFMTEERGLYAISVAAERADMQIQNLRVYERRGLLEPARTPGGTRLYSDADIVVLQRIAELLAEGLNLAGIRRVLELEAELALLRQRVGQGGVRRGSPTSEPRIELGATECPHGSSGCACMERGLASRN